MAEFQPEPNEKLLVRVPYASWMKSEMNEVSGQLLITNLRFLFIKDMHPVLGFLSFLNKDFGSHKELEYRRSEITSAKKIAAGKDERLLIETVKDRPRIFKTIKIDTVVTVLNEKE